MKNLYKQFRHIATVFQKIKLVDRCLILFMTLLMLQSTYSLFFNEANSQETSNIDIVVRTTSAAIFGYFLSANFLKSQPHDNRPNSDTDTINPNDPSPNDPDLNTLSIQPQREDRFSANNQQIIIATVIGITSLCILILVRNFFILTPGMLSTVSQMRDFVSGCVGFLLGYPSSESGSDS